MIDLLLLFGLLANCGFTFWVWKYGTPKLEPKKQEPLPEPTPPGPFISLEEACLKALTRMDRIGVRDEGKKHDRVLLQLKRQFPSVDEQEVEDLIDEAMRLIRSGQ